MPLILHFFVYAFASSNSIIKQAGQTFKQAPRQKHIFLLPQYSGSNIAFKQLDRVKRNLPTRELKKRLTFFAAKAVAGLFVIVFAVSL